MGDRGDQTYLLSIRFGCSATSFGMRACDDQAAVTKAAQIVERYEVDSGASIELLRADGRYVTFRRAAVVRDIAKSSPAVRDAARGAAA